MSDPQNPLIDPSPTGNSLPTELQLPSPSARVPEENPSWSGWEVIGIVLIGFAALVFAIAVVVLLGHKFLYPNEPIMEGTQQRPVLLIGAQALSYLAVIGFMVFLVKRSTSQKFGSAIRWNWPAKPWVYLASGVVLSLALQFLGHFLPIPKDLPMDRFFRTPLDAWVLAIFGVFIAPLMEELFFRGFLYPVLVRRLGVIVSVVLTAIAFASVHVSQLNHAWGPVLIIFLVGVTLTTARAQAKSVAAGWLIHFAYNGTIFSLMFLATDGFRHMDKLTQ